MSKFNDQEVEEVAQLQMEVVEEVVVDMQKILFQLHRIPFIK